MRYTETVLSFYRELLHCSRRLATEATQEVGLKSGERWTIWKEAGSAGYVCICDIT